jgi:hypothetical protein
MRSIKIYNIDKNEFYRIFPDDVIEYVNPITYFTELQIRKRAILYRDIVEIEYPDLVKEQDSLDNLFFEKKAAKDVMEEMEIDTKLSIPENFVKLLKSNTKGQQKKLLKNQMINLDQLHLFIIKAYVDQGFLYSRYVSENYPKEFDTSALPLLTEKKENGTLNKIGDTELTDGRLKQLIEQKKIITANFLDKDEDWHCIFITQGSLEGKESWKNGQPHFHYISDKWGLKREDVVDAIKKGNYLTTNVHIKFEKNNFI